MKTLSVAVPPGVGDIYWCLTKLKALRDHEGADHVRLCIQEAGPKRSIEWPGMVDFVDSGSWLKFHPPQPIPGNGFVRPFAGADCLLWPNAVVDAGRPLADWLPELEIDIDFTIKTVPLADPLVRPRVVVYASAEGVNRAWCPNFGPEYWARLITVLDGLFGEVTLIGAHWDKPFADQVSQQCLVSFENLVQRTSLPQIAGVLRDARVVVGVISGMTILANHFRTPTIAFYPQAHHPDFPRTWVAPEAPYKPLLAPEAPDAADVAKLAFSMAWETTDGKA